MQSFAFNSVIAVSLTFRAVKFSALSTLIEVNLLQPSASTVSTLLPPKFNAVNVSLPFISTFVIDWLPSSVMLSNVVFSSFNSEIPVIRDRSSVFTSVRDSSLAMVSVIFVTSPVSTIFVVSANVSVISSSVISWISPAGTST